MTPDWLFPLLSIVVGLVAGWIGAHVGAKVAIAQLETRMGAAEQEIVKLRIAKHEHSQFITRHELDIDHMKMMRDKR